MRILRLKRFWCILLLPLAYGAVCLASAYPSVTERIYSRGLYPWLAGLFGRISSVFPFSITQWLVILGPLALLAYIIRETACIIKSRELRGERVLKLMTTLVAIGTIAYFLFIFTCGLNYHRESVAVYSGLTVRPSSAQELAELCEELVVAANLHREQILENSDGVMISSFGGYSELASYARSTYREAGGVHAPLGGYTVRPKPVLFSRGMSYLDITGVYIPFLFEPNVNVDVHDFWIPSTTMHELAHSKGYMREEEANFIAYLTCVDSGHPDFQYSGLMLALVHSTNALYATDRELYWAVTEQYGDGIRRDLAANAAYWKQFEGPVAEVSAAVNDSYLKSNRQQSGVKSYGQMVDLLLADYRQRHGLE